MDVNFPSPAFGWVFFIALLSVLIAACVIDFRRRTIPNRLTVPALVAGFVVNAIGHGMIGSPTDEAVWGSLGGLLFSLKGFFFGFLLFLVFWLIGLCRGGDVKLFAAVASWLGWLCSFWVWLLSFMIMSAMMVFLVLARSRAGTPISERDNDIQTDAALPKQGKRVPYSFALTIAVAIVLLWLQMRR